MKPIFFSLFLFKKLQDEVAKLLDSSDPSRYRIPLCVGDVEVVLDRRGENSVKVMLIL